MRNKPKRNTTRTLNKAQRTFLREQSARHAAVIKSVVEALRAHRRTINRALAKGAVNRSELAAIVRIVGALEARRLGFIRGRP